MNYLSIGLLATSLYAGGVMAQRTIVEIEPEAAVQQESGKVLKRKVAIGRFSNETQYAKGLFYDKENDPMGRQASDILSTRLAASGKFLLLERNDLDKLQEENQLNKSDLQKIGADYLILGSITQFGRKDVGNQRVFSSTKSQIVEAAVSIRLVDVKTGKAGFDATLSDKAISAAISKLVENVINKCTDAPWRAYILAADENGVIISGGASQGISVGDRFAVKTRGKQVTNPQTGIQFELPGKVIGQVKVEAVQGNTPETEFSLVSVTEGEIDPTQLNNYYIEEIQP